MRFAQRQDLWRQQSRQVISIWSLGRSRLSASASAMLLLSPPCLGLRLWGAHIECLPPPPFSQGVSHSSDSTGFWEVEWQLLLLEV
jgi:hypothetical protein